MQHDPYCFVVMPFGKKPDPGGRALIDFDRIYHDALVPAIESVGMRPYRDDLAAVGGFVQKQIFEALLLCDYAVADLTIENSNVFYELGVRHAVRPASTLTISARPDSIPFDVRNIRSLRYRLDNSNGLGSGLAVTLRDGVARELEQLRRHVRDGTTIADSPLFQLIEGWRPGPAESLKTDLFAERVEHDHRLKQRLARSRAAGCRAGDERRRALEDVHALAAELGDPEGAEAGLLVEILLTYRALEDWDSMVRFVGDLPGYVRERTLVQEQLAFALNRRADRTGERDRDEALAILVHLDNDKRSTSETFGLIGRVHKDRWRQASDPDQRRVHLNRAIHAYEHGFQLDPRDPYPGINAAALLRVSGVAAGERRLSQLLAVVEYATERLLATEKPTYWMHATLVECAAIRRDADAGLAHVDKALDAEHEPWEVHSTVGNLTDLMDAGAADPWVSDAVARLRRACAG